MRFPIRNKPKFHCKLFYDYLEMGPRTMDSFDSDLFMQNMLKNCSIYDWEAENYLKRYFWFRPIYVKTSCEIFLIYYWEAEKQKIKGINGF